MLKIIINKHKYKYRTKQSEISWRVGNLINDTLEEYKGDKESIEFQKWCLSFLSNTTYDIIDQVSNDQISFLIKNHPFFADNILNRFRKYIKINHKLYEYRDLELSMSVLEYGEIDDLGNNLDFLSIIKRLYKPIYCTPKHWLKYLILKNVKNLEECNYFELQLAIFYFFMWKKNLMAEYNLLIDNPFIPKEDQPDEVIQTPEEKFGLYHVLMTVCGDDIQKFHFWMDKDIKELFKYIYYLRIKDSK